MLSFPAKCNTTHLMLSDLFSLCNVSFTTKMKYSVSMNKKKAIFPKPVWFIRVVDSPMVAHPNICGAGVVTHIAFENALLTNRIWATKKKRREIHTNQKKRMSPSSKLLNNHQHHVYKKWVNDNYTLFVILKSAWNENSLNLYCKYMLLILLWTIHTCMFHVLIKLSF